MIVAVCSVASKGDFCPFAIARWMGRRKGIG